jgi:hypothetical protein
MRRPPASLTAILEKIGELPQVEDKQAGARPALRPNQWNHWARLAHTELSDAAAAAADDALAVQCQRADYFEAALAAELLARRALVEGNPALCKALLEAAEIVAKAIQKSAVPC